MLGDVDTDDGRNLAPPKIHKLAGPLKYVELRLFGLFLGA